ncbi:MAG: methyltransferase, partial [bacterium]
PLVAAKMPLRRFKHLLDLGGGPGVYAISLCEANPNLRATVFDLPDPLKIAREEIAAAGLRNRMKVKAGDFLKDSLGSGYDVVLISSIVHALGEKEILFLLKKVRRAIEPNGLVVVKDFFLNPDFCTPAPAAHFAINMLVNTERGRCYSFGEMTRYLKETGFAKIRRIRITDRDTLILGRAD